MNRHKITRILKLNRILKNIKCRCYVTSNAAYKDYGERGITVCSEWRADTIAFILWALDSGYKQGLQLDRIDNDGGYTPNNCRFVSRSINNMNRRSHKNSLSKYLGVSINGTRWRWAIKYQGEYLYKYGFDTQFGAALARDKFILYNDLPHKLNLLTRRYRNARSKT